MRGLVTEWQGARCNRWRVGLVTTSLLRTFPRKQSHSFFDCQYRICRGRCDLTYLIYHFVAQSLNGGRPAGTFLNGYRLRRSVRRGELPCGARDRHVAFCNGHSYSLFCFGWLQPRCITLKVVEECS